MYRKIKLASKVANITTKYSAILLEKENFAILPTQMLTINGNMGIKSKLDSPKGVKISKKNKIKHIRVHSEAKNAINIKDNDLFMGRPGRIRASNLSDISRTLRH